MRLFYLFFALCALLFTSCADFVKGDDVMTTQEYEFLTEVDAIEVQSIVNLKLSNDVEPGNLTITANSNIQKYITVSYPGDRILVAMDNNDYRNVEVTVLASASQYGSIIASGIATITKDSVTGGFTDFNITLSGASSFSGDVTVKNRLSLNLKGSAKVSIAGMADDCEINAVGTSSVSGYDFSCDDLDIVLAGSSSVKMTVNETIEGEMSGASKINYRGSDSVQVAVVVSGTASVNYND